MSRRRNVQARTHAQTHVYDGHRPSGITEQASTDKNITTKTKNYVRVPSYTAKQGDGNGKTGSKEAGVRQARKAAKSKS